MGVFDFVKEGTREMRVARRSDAPIAVHAEQTLPLYGELDVDRDDCAVFVRGARAIGILGPGRHTLHTSKIPFLDDGEVGLVPEGRIAAHVVFVRLSPIAAERFSAKLDGVTDPVTRSAVSSRLEGNVTVRVVDPAAFVEDHLRAPERPLFTRPGVVVEIERVRIRDGEHVTSVAAPSAAASLPDEPANEERGAPMDCRACGTRGEVGTFCEGCGALLSARARCVACRAALEPDARFCAGCGVRTDADVQPRTGA